jgi:diguanylate cyclase (GGDEF)-like protein/PAS domain S-box-containing protein
MKDALTNNPELIENVPTLKKKIRELEQSIEESVRTEEALRESEAKFRFLSENLADVAFTVDMDLRTTYASPSIEKILGFTPEERRTQPAEEQLTPQSLQVVFKTLMEEMEREKLDDADPERSNTMALEYYHKDGSIKILETNTRGIRNSKGVLTGFYGLSRDITERKKAEEALHREYSFRNTIIDNVAEGLCVCNEIKEFPFVNFTVWNDCMTKITGYTVEEINRLGWHQTVYPDPELQAKAIECMKKMRQGVNLRAEEWEITCADGNKRVLNISTSVVESDNGVVHILALMQDITECKRIEQAYRDSEFKYRSLIEHSSDVVFCVDKNGEYKFVNQVFASTFGKTPDYFLGKSFWDIYPKEHADHRQATSIKVFETGESQSVEVVVPLPDRTLHYIAKANPVKDETGKVVLNVTHAIDITERKLMEEALRESEKKYRELSIIDDLTQLYNSRYFYQQLRMEIDRVNRYGQPLTLLLLDLDDFKLFNDAYGHVEGDQVLFRLGQVVKRWLRQTDSAYRYGGEEFTIMLPMTSSADGAVTAERIRAELKKEIFVPESGEKVHVTLSIGLAQYKPQEDMKAFIHRVDQLMYQGKKNGKDRVCCES